MHDSPTAMNFFLVLFSTFAANSTSFFSKTSFYLFLVLLKHAKVQPNLSPQKSSRASADPYTAWRLLISASAVSTWLVRGRGMGFQMLQRQSENAKKKKQKKKQQQQTLDCSCSLLLPCKGFNFCACGHPLKGGELGHKYLATENIIISAIGAQHVGTHTPLSALLGWSWRSHYDRKSSKEFLIFCTVAWTRVHHDETGFQGRPCVHYFLVTCTANSIKQSSVPRS